MREPHLSLASCRRRRRRRSSGGHPRSIPYLRWCCVSVCLRHWRRWRRRCRISDLYKSGVLASDSCARAPRFMHMRQKLMQSSWCEYRFGLESVERHQQRHAIGIWLTCPSSGCPRSAIPLSAVYGEYVVWAWSHFWGQERAIVASSSSDLLWIIVASRFGSHIGGRGKLCLFNAYAYLVCVFKDFCSNLQTSIVDKNTGQPKNTHKNASFIPSAPGSHFRSF